MTPNARQAEKATDDAVIAQLEAAIGARQDGTEGAVDFHLQQAREAIAQEADR